MFRALRIFREEPLLLIPIFLCIGFIVGIFAFDALVVHSGLAAATWNMTIAFFGILPLGGWAIALGCLLTGGWLWLIVRVKMVQHDLEKGVQFGLICDAHLLQKIANDRDALVQDFAWAAAIGLGCIGWGIVRLIF